MALAEVELETRQAAVASQEESAQAIEMRRQAERMALCSLCSESDSTTDTVKVNAEQLHENEEEERQLKEREIEERRIAQEREEAEKSTKHRRSIRKNMTSTT